MQFKQISTLPDQIVFESYDQIRKRCVADDDVQDDKLYGSGLIMAHSKYQIPLILVNKASNSQETFKQLRQEIELRKAIKCPTITQLINYKVSEESTFCGSFYKANIIYEYNNYNLRNYLKIKKKITEKQLLIITDSVVSALIVFQQNQIRHGAIQPQNILVVEKNNLIFFSQLTDIRFLTSMYEYQQQLMGFSEECYLSPCLLDELGKRTLNPIYNYQKSEIFSLGVTLLEIGLNKNVQSIYDLDLFKIRQSAIESLLQQLNQIYSQKFCDLVRQMIQIDEKLRCSLNDLVLQLDNLMKNQSMNSYAKSLVKPNQRSKTPNNFDQFKTTEKFEQTSPMKPNVYQRTQSPIYHIDYNDKESNPKTPSTSFISKSFDDKLNLFKHDLTNFKTKIQKYDDDPILSQTKQYEYPKIETTYHQDSSLNYKKSYEFQQQSERNTNYFLTVPSRKQEKAYFENQQEKEKEKEKVIQQSDRVYHYLTPPKFYKGSSHLLPNDVNGIKVNEPNTQSNPKFDQSFRQLEEKLLKTQLDRNLENFNRITPVQEAQNSIKVEKQKQNQQPQKQAVLPSSDVIYLHSNESSYLNDFFLDKSAQSSFKY